MNQINLTLATLAMLCFAGSGMAQTMLGRGGLSIITPDGTGGGVVNRPDGSIEFLTPTYGSAGATILGEDGLSIVVPDRTGGGVVTRPDGSIEFLTR